MALIDMENIRKSYRSGENTVEALQDITLKVEQGEFLAVVGSSGSGKSTLMNLLGCLDQPDEGSYLLDGIDIPAQDEKSLSCIRNTKIGFIFQGFHLIPTLNAMENTELPLIYRGIPRAEREKRAAEALARMGLKSRAGHRPFQLSGGQQQRVAIARAIACRPPLILADEPTGNLDTETGQEVMKALLELNQDGHTVILITHDPRVAAMAQRIIRIQDGKIQNISDLEPFSGFVSAGQPL